MEYSSASLKCAGQKIWTSTWVWGLNMSIVKLDWNRIPPETCEIPYLKLMHGGEQLLCLFPSGLPFIFRRVEAHPLNGCISITIGHLGPSPFEHNSGSMAGAVNSNFLAGPNEIWGSPAAGFSFSHLNEIAGRIWERWLVQTFLVHRTEHHSAWDIHWGSVELTRVNPPFPPLTWGVNAASGQGLRPCPVPGFCGTTGYPQTPSTPLLHRTVHTFVFPAEISPPPGPSSSVFFDQRTTFRDPKTGGEERGERLREPKPAELVWRRSVRVLKRMQQIRWNFGIVFFSGIVLASFFGIVLAYPMHNYYFDIPMNPRSSLFPSLQ